MTVKLHGFGQPPDTCSDAGVSFFLGAFDGFYLLWITSRSCLDGHVRRKPSMIIRWTAAAGRPIDVDRLCELFIAYHAPIALFRLACTPAKKP
jgi:hypothetical protein